MDIIKHLLLTGGVSVLGFVSMTAMPLAASANDQGGNINQVLSQVRANQSWTTATFPVANGAVTTAYGSGVAIAAPKGTAVRSWLTGRVEQISMDASCGVNVVIRSGPWQHRYCSLQGVVGQDGQGRIMLSDAGAGIELRQGQHVVGGSAIGRVAVGRAIGKSALYWQLNHQGRPVNPAQVLQIMQVQQQPPAQTAMRPVQLATRLSPQRLPQVAPQMAAPARNPGGLRANTSPITTQPNILALRQAIIGQESGNNPNIVNPHSGALGLGQVMPENVAEWSQAALGYSITPEEFLANPQLQLRIIDYKLTEYWQRAIRRSAGDEAIAVRMVAAQWYSGDPNLYDKGALELYNGHEYPSIRNYTLSVLARYQTLRVANR